MNDAQYISTLSTPAKLLPLDLSTVMTDHIFNISGNSLGVWLAPQPTDQIFIRFNEQDEPAFPFRQAMVLPVKFNKIFVTIPGTSVGIMHIVYGADPELIKMHVRPEDIPGTLIDILEELQGQIGAGTYNQTPVGVAAVQVIAANANRHGCSIEADFGNGQPIYIGFDNTVAANKCIRRLNALGFWSIDDYRGPVYSIAAGPGQNVNWAEW